MLFLTRCPACNTTFRMTREQLLVRDGKVRCGACRHVFNAMEHLLEETAPEELRPAPAAPAAPAGPVTTEPPAPPPPAPSTPEPALEIEIPAAAPPAPEIPRQAATPPSAPEPAPLPAPAPVAATDAPARKPRTRPAPQEPQFHPDELGALTIWPALDQAQAKPEAARPLITPEDLDPAPKPRDPIDAAMDAGEGQTGSVKQQGLEAGLLAPRDLTEIPGFSRWAAAPLEDLGTPPAPRALWPFVLASLILSLALTAQAALHYRGELSRKLPATQPLFEKLGLDIPLAREAEWISIEASDLHSETTPGRLQLAATLQNRAPYAQAWPQLELTLTDTYDAVLVRKVFGPGDYLPAAAPASFAPGDTPVRLNLEAGELRPSGYRLYLFYP
ncbi:zinc-ribbon and DUF3426 domain-containing protein [Azovibrio restrictus]|uniref:zinc-ribbon and DUF3426 domain-containing protein n=1 Tax=Azovibrio restrictus TaxID=146938 RepID=UPI0026F042EA|nr:zinc-ribbon and DUF3426 domain-containing protein [Azovibrio restrictus]MDD3481610.1 zinc-ribbon and DUF3426 domain-containing protein [Azovibrio restrictus]